MYVATPTGPIFVRFIFGICWHILAMLSVRYELRLKRELSIEHDLL